MSLLLLPDIVIGLSVLFILLVLLDKTTGRILVHLDTLRQLAYQAGMDLISLFSGWEFGNLDVERRVNLVEFEQKTLEGIGPGEAVELLKEHRNEMRHLK